MPNLSIYLKNGVTLTEESTDDFERLRDMIEGFLDCGESIVIERDGLTADDRRTRVALVIPANAVSVVRIEEPIADAAPDSTMQHVEVL